MQTRAARSERKSGSVRCETRKAKQKKDLTEEKDTYHGMADLPEHLNGSGRSRKRRFEQRDRSTCPYHPRPRAPFQCHKCCNGVQLIDLTGQEWPGIDRAGPADGPTWVSSIAWSVTVDSRRPTNKNPLRRMPDDLRYRTLTPSLIPNPFRASTEAYLPSIHRHHARSLQKQSCGLTLRR